jgi:hypothetical protein
LKLSLQDVWALASDRRFENLDMPILDDLTYSAKADKGSKAVDLIELDCDLPRKLQSFTGFIKGEESTVSKLPMALKLSAVLRYLASPIRYEPRNLPEVHYPMSSFGGFFSSNINLIYKGYDSNQTVNSFVYHPNYHALEKLSTKQGLEESLSQGELVFALVGQYWTVGRKYGEYSPYGVVIDSGIAFAQLSYLLRLFGFSFSVKWSGLESLQTYFESKEGGQQLLVTVKVELTESIEQIFKPAQRRRIAVWKEPKGIFEQFSNLREIASVFSAPYIPNAELESCGVQEDPVCIELPNLKLAKNHDMFDVISNRSAGNDNAGFVGVSKDLEDDFLNNFLKTLAALGAKREKVPLEQESLSLNTAWINPYGPEQGIYDGSGNLVFRPEGQESYYQTLRDSLHNSQQLYNLPSMTMILFITADIEDASSRAGTSSVRIAHIGAGAMVHDICLAASLFGCFARPVRMFREAKLSQKFELKGQVVIQVLVGFARNNNFSMALI